MIRLSVIAVCLLVLAGCGDRRQPKVQKVPASVDHGRWPAVSPPSAPSSHSPQSPHAMSAGMQNAQTLGPEVQLGNLRLTAPKDWIRTPGQTSIIRAEFSLPRAEGDEADGRLTVGVVGGGVKPNIDRWQGQFEGGANQKPPEEIEIAGLTVTTVDFSGALSSGHGTATAGGVSQNHRMLGAIIPLGSRLGFVKCTGPEKTIEKHADQFQAFLRSLKPVKPG